MGVCEHVWICRAEVANFNLIMNYSTPIFLRQDLNLARLSDQQAPGILPPLQGWGSKHMRPRLAFGTGAENQSRILRPV